MNGWRDTTDIRSAHGSDPFADPVVLAWDTIARGSAMPLAGSNAADVATLRQFLALDPVPEPSPGFFGTLEERLRTVEPAGNGQISGAGIPITRHPTAKARITSIARPGGYGARWGAAAAVLVALIVAGLLVTWWSAPRSIEPPAIPAAVAPKPTMETLVQFDFAPSMWGMPVTSAWTYMYLSISELDPGESFTTNAGWYTATDGPLLLMVLSGELSIQPVGPALLYSAAQGRQAPLEVAAGTTVSLEPNDAIIYSSTPAATGSNLSNEPARILIGLAGRSDSSVSGSSSPPVDVRLVTWDDIGTARLLPTRGATVSLQRVELAPFDTYVVEPNTQVRFVAAVDPAQTESLRLVAGAVNAVSPGMAAGVEFRSSQLSYMDAGPHTLVNLGDETIDLYFLVVEAPASEATPSP